MDRQYSYHRIAGAIGLCSALLLAGCSNEQEERHAGEGMPVPVTIRLSSESLPGVATKGGNTAELITPDDRINTLDIYITDGSNRIEKHLTEADFTLNEASNQGTSVTFNLKPGAKQVYAFSNADGEAFKSLGLADGWTAVPEAVRTNGAFAVTGAISEKNGIPMSALTRWVVDKNTSGYGVTLVRMVGRMSVRLIDERKPVEENSELGAVTSLALEGLLPDKTCLFRKAKGEVTLPENVQMGNRTIENPQTVTDKDADTPYQFYLHETKGQFTVELQIADETDNAGQLEPRRAVLDRMIPRNYHFPLNIYLRDFTLAIEGTYEYAPIGVLPIQKEIAIAPGGYEITLPEGSSNIRLKVRLREGTETILKQDVNWEIDNITSDIPGFSKEIAGADAPEADRAALFLSIPALPAEASETPRTIQIQLKHANHELAFKLTLKTRALEEGDLTTTKSGFNGPDRDVITIEL